MQGRAAEASPLINIWEVTMSGWLGVDVSSKRLDVHWQGDDQSFANSSKGIAKLQKWLRDKDVDGVVVDATGGYEWLVWKTLHESGYGVAVVNPWRLRRYAQALGFLAKTDEIDASVAADYGEKVGPRFCVPKGEVAKQMQDLVARRKQLVEMRTQELNRRHRATESVAPSLQAVIECLDAQIEDVENQLESLILQSEEDRKKLKIVESYCGIGRRIGISLLVLLPELGQVNNKEIAALGGLAPWMDQSGKRDGERHIFGGRAAVRSLLFMAALVARRFNPVIRAFAERLLAKGKKPRVVTIACARRILVHLNAMVRHGEVWDATKVLRTSKTKEVAAI
jgi:transposase